MWPGTAIVALARRERADYVVLHDAEGATRLDLPVAFSNGAWTVYRVPR